ncbi:MAG TPA: 3-phosphoshikimate 1-carboxyvinyltransferase [Candidatus Binatia bacterium]|nr:3-phosphoshikimate 1-carboxyvinyltransferase [Candidatus Binatia bacterium]
MTRVGPPRGGLRGTVDVPGDKSIAHRALLLGALAEGATTIHRFPGGADVLSTLGAVRALGAGAERRGDTVRVEGRGSALGPPGDVRVDCGNSGTTMRLGAGLVAGGPGCVVLDGDASLRRRPMERVAEPLRRMGARVETTDGHAPLTVRGGRLAAIDCRLPVASAQVKSAVLLAGLRAAGTTRVREPLVTRDHTERLLGHFGVRVARHPDGAAVAGGQRLVGTDVPLPGDPSSAAFLVVAALLVPDSRLILRDVGLNPTRTGFLDVLGRMGAGVEVADTREVAGEPWGTLRVRSVRLRATTIGPAEIPGTIDELPVLCVAAALAEGETTIAGAGELRVKESDRIAGIEQLRLLGVDVRTTPDGIAIRGRAGRPLAGGAVATAGDHRIAMAFAVAGLVATDGVVLDDAGCADVSFPGFFARLAALGASVSAP